MKKLLFSIVCFVLFTSLYAQSVPQGMKYQAVARDLSGQILAETDIDIQINLVAKNAKKESTYTEIHQVTTNKLGLFTLNIGEGTVEKGSFASVPWHFDEVWMEIMILEKGEFVTISKSKMLSVPYAFHAATANELIGGDGSGRNGNGNGPGVPSQNWSLFGNSTSDPLVDKLGTTDLADLVIVTNNIERMRILEDGDIEIVNSLNIGKDLSVEENVYLNTLSGQTINNGPFTVDNVSPTLLTGSLTVATQSPTLLSGTLTVDLETDLNSSLNVDGITNLQSALNVFNTSPTYLSGALEVDKDAVFHEHVLLDNAAHQSTSVTTGALVVSGGLGLGKNLNVGGASTFGGPVQFNSPVTISAEEESTNLTTGALRVAGGVGIGKRLNVGGATALLSTLDVTSATTLNNTLGVTGATTLGNSLTVAGASQLNNTLGVTGVTNISNATQSNSTGTGALIVAGGVGIGGNLNVGGSFDVTKNAGTGHVASFTNTGDGNGISIKVGAATPHNNNNFITFLNNGGSVVGRIEGENGAADLANNREYQDDLAFKQTAIALSVTGEVIAIAEEIQAVVEVVAAAASTTACVGLGVCVTAPIPSFIISEAAGLIVATANLVLQTADLATVIADLVVFENTHEALFGITFASGSEDYAEYLPKLNPGEKFLPGDVVGIKNGYVTKNTTDVDQIMVISHKPAVLGGLPPDEHTADYEIVAFMGQVPTRIAGEVKQGDYILPSGYNNGFGVGRSPELMKAKDYKQVLGIAWEENKTMSIGLVNTAIGLNTNDLTDLFIEQENKLKKQQEKVAQLESQILETTDILKDLIPGFAAALNQDGTAVDHIIANEDHESHHAEEGHNHDAHQINYDEKSFSDVAMENGLTELNSDEIVYFPVDRHFLEKALVMAEDAFEKSGIDLSNHPFWQRIHAEPDYKEEVFAKIGEKLKTAMHTHHQIDLQMTEN